MSDEFDINAVTTAFLKANFDDAVSVAKSSLGGTKNFLLSQFEITYKSYIRRLTERHAKARSFFIRSEPVGLYDFFVPLDLQTQRTTLPKPTAADLGLSSRASILFGNGGSGKSMMMRHFLLSSLAGREKTPLFVELRSLNSGKESVLEILLAALTANGLNVNAAYLDAALRKGHFLILLDGYDELTPSVREATAKAIQEIAERYPQNWLVVSSRPDAELEGWVGFTTWRVAPLDLNRAIELVERLPFDEVIKSNFIEALRRQLFASHASFLSNPLLLSIMLLTYHDTASIPSRLSVFYNQAYEALFQKHDALKAGYKREKLTSLDIQEFAKVFAAFSIQSLDKREFSFSSTRALEILDRTKPLTHLPFNSQDFLRDAVQAVCLLVEEGIDIAFAHRSFQEYFTAVFISQATPDQREQLIQRFSRTGESDQVIPLLYEIDPYSVERHYVLPTIARIKKVMEFKRSVGKTQHAKFLRAVFSDFHIGEGGKLVSTIRNMELFQATIFIHRTYLHDVLAPTEERKKAIKGVSTTFIKCYGEHSRVPAQKVLADKAFASALEQAPSFWSRASVERLLELENTIEKRHQEAQDSIDSILLA